MGVGGGGVGNGVGGGGVGYGVGDCVANEKNNEFRNNQSINHHKRHQFSIDTINTDKKYLVVLVLDQSATVPNNCSTNVNVDEETKFSSHFHSKKNKKLQLTASHQSFCTVHITPKQHNDHNVDKTIRQMTSTVSERKQIKT